MAIGRTENIIRTLTQEEANRIGRQVEELLQNEMRYIANKYVRQFQVAAKDTFGWTHEDLMQQVRVALWKGLATFEPDKKFKLTTYLSKILFHHFMSLSKRCRSSKNALSKLYCVEDVFDTFDTRLSEILPEEMVNADNAKEYFFSKLTTKEIRILETYMTDRSVITNEEIAKKHGLSKTDVVETMRAIRKKAEWHRRELEDEEEDYFEPDNVSPEY